MPLATIVIPCYNEAKRLRNEAFRELVATNGPVLLFVDDGSTDATVERLQSIIAECRGQASLLQLARNSGKAEAVRQGMLAAIANGATMVGYTDADLSTPAGEVLRLAKELATRQARVVMGSRVLLLGTDIRRRPIRHYLGRIFATCASLALALAVYDTQCGAKFFRVTPVLKRALERPFTSGWAFDVELIARLLTPDKGERYTVADFVEIPLQAWHDVAGSKVTIRGGARAFADLLRIGRYVRRHRAT